MGWKSMKYALDCGENAIDVETWLRVNTSVFENHGATLARQLHHLLVEEREGQHSGLPP